MYCELMEEVPVIREIHLGGGTPTFFSPANLSLLINAILETSIMHIPCQFQSGRTSEQYNPGTSGNPLSVGFQADQLWGAG